MSENKKKLTKEEKIAKAKELLNEIAVLELTKEDLVQINAGGPGADTTSFDFTLNNVVMG